MRCSELELESELDGTGATDLVEGIETAIGAAGRRKLASICVEWPKRGWSGFVGVPEVGVIEDIEELGAETQVQPFRKCKLTL